MASGAADVPVGSLQLGDELGSGGEGKVVIVGNRPGTVFKRYYKPGVNGQSLRALVSFPASLPEDARDKLLGQAAWPLACVTDGPAAVGFLMNRVPAEFTGRTGAGTKLRELQYLLYPPKPMWGEITPPAADARIQVARAFVTLLRILQDQSVVLGDISMRNLLWSPRSPAGIFLLDCDSAVLPGMPPVMSGVVQTPGWEDPNMPAAGPDLDTDRYKAALVIGRILAANAEARPGTALGVLPQVRASVAGPVGTCFRDAAGPHGTRPDLSTWAQALSGREMIAVTPPAPLPPAPRLPEAELDGRGPRESIALPPFGGRRPPPP